MRWASAALLLTFPLCAQQPTTPADVFSRVHADLKRMPESQRLLVRYLWLPAESKESLGILSGHANGLSTNADLVKPVSLGGGLYRVNLLDYGWDEGLWETLGKQDPYFHVTLETTKDVVLAPWLTETPDQRYLTEEVAYWTQSRAPVLRADWWLHQTAVQEGRKAGYYEWLGIKDLKGFEKLVRFDAKLGKDLDHRRTVVFSGVVRQPRGVVMDYTVLGKLFRTQDSVLAVDRKNPLRVLGTDHDFDATEQFAPLPNGLPAWFLGNRAGERQNEAPTTIVQDNIRVQINYNCIDCHLGRSKHEQGVLDIPPLPIGRLKAVDYAKLVELRRQYTRNIEPHLAAERANYAAAIKQATGLEPQEYARAYVRAYRDYEDGRIGAEQAALEWGVTKDQLLKALRDYDARTDNLDPVLSILMNGGEIPRVQFEEVYATGHLVLRGLVQP